MIDEDLYQQAADELNSERRRPALWARACALASDDHDEARYLYTNLRVEELIAERALASEAPDGASANVATSDIASGEIDDITLALEPVSDTPNEADAQDVFDEYAANRENDLTLQLSSTPSGVDNSEASDDILDFEAFASEISSDETSDQSLKPKPPEPDADLMEDYVPEQDKYLDDTYVNQDDTYANEGTVGESFDDELARFQAEESSKTPDVAESEKSLEQTDESLTNDEFDSTAHLGLNRADRRYIAENGDVSETQSDSSSEPDANDAELSPEHNFDLTQANVAVLDANARDLDNMLAEVQSNQESTAAPDEEADWLDASFEEDDIFNKDDTSLESIIDEPDPLHEKFKNQADELDLDDTKPDSEPRLLDGTDESWPNNNLPEEPTEQYREDIGASAGASAGELDVSGELENGVSAEQDNDKSELAAPAAAAATAASTAAASGAFSTPSAAAPVHGETDSIKGADFPLDLTEGRKGSLYSVYRRDTSAQAVRSGVSWSALFLTLPYLLYRQLFGTAIVYIALWVIAVGGLIISGLAWLDAGDAVTPIVQACTIGFALVAFIGLLYLPFRYANQWRTDKLENRGYELVAITRAQNSGRAVARARRHAAFD